MLLIIACLKAAAASLTGTVTNIPAGAAISLTSTGSMDWLHLGLDAVTNVNRRMSLLPRISTPALLDPANPAVTSITSMSFSWTNGIPILAATHSGALAVTNVGNGFDFTVAADATVKKVQLFVTARAVGLSLDATLSDSSAPVFTDSWSTVTETNCAYVLSYAAASAQQTVRIRLTMTSALDTNATLMLAAVALTRVGTNQAPTIAITSPTNEANVTAGDIVLNTVAADNDGAVAKVEFFDSGVKFGESTNAPFSFLWMNAPLGIHSVTARVTDDEGTNRATSTLTFFVVTNGGTVGGLLSAPTGSVNLTVEGIADWIHWGYLFDESVDRKAGVTPLLSNVTLVGTGPWYQFADNYNGYTWTDGTPTARATATPTGIYIFGINNGFEIQAPADVGLRTLRLHVGAYAARGRLRAYLSDFSAPVFSDAGLYNGGNGPGGIYSITYRAASSGKKLIVRYTVASTAAGDGNITLQAATLVTENNPPFASLGAPTNGAVFSAGVPIPLAASASDSDGTVSRVEFLSDGAVVAVSSNAPFSVNWTNASAGSHVVTARAVDNLGATMVSGPSTIAVVTGGGYLRGSINSNAPAAANLSTEGIVDWAHWGLLNKASFNHMSPVSSQIGNASIVGGTSQQYANNYTTFTWTNGTPTSSANATRTGIFVTGLSNGFALTVNADKALRRIRVYAGLYGARSRFEASLSDNSAAPYVDTSLSKTYANGYAVYTVDFAAASTNQQLRIRYTGDAMFDPTYGNVTLQAATLSSVTTVVPFSLGAGAFTGSFNSLPNLRYVVEYTDRVPTNTWQVLTNVVGNGANATFVDPAAPGSARFYRVRAN